MDPSVFVSSGGKVKSSGGTPTRNSSDKKDYSKDFREVFDWFEIRISEINEQLDLMGAKLENTILSKKNSAIDQIIAKNKTELAALDKGYKLYDAYAKKLLKKIPKKYRAEAQNGKISIEQFKGKTDEQTLERIKEYREWAEKAADVKKQIQEINKEIAQLAKQKIDNVVDLFDNRIAVYDQYKQDRVQNHIDLQEESGKRVSAESYNKLIDEENQKKKRLTDSRDKAQKELDNAVKTGKIKYGSEEWWEAIQTIQDLDNQIDQANLSVEQFKNKINEIEWENFEKLIERFDAVSDEMQNMIDVMTAFEEPITKPDVETGWGADDVKWSGEGLMSIGLYAAQMEQAQIKAQEYQAQMDDLRKKLAAGEISQDEYNEKMKEAVDGQHEAIKEYNGAKKAIIDLNKQRVDAIKEGIQKEIDSYSKLIAKKKESLNADKDAYDFQRNVQNQQKDISKLERQIAALATDTSASGIAKRRQLEAELAKLKDELEETYYDRSVTVQQEGLDKLLEAFQDQKEKEIEALEKSLEDTEKIIKDSFDAFLNNSEDAGKTFEEYLKTYGINMTDSFSTIMSSVSNLVDSYTGTFGGDRTDGTSGVEQGNNGIRDEEKKQQEEADKDAKDNNKTVDDAGSRTVQQRDQKYYFNPYTGGKKTIKEALKEQGESTSKNNMQRIAYANGITNYTGTAEQDKILFDKMQKGELKRGATKYKKYEGKKKNFKDALKEMGISTSYENLARIAYANGYNYNKSKANEVEKKLFEKLKKGTLKFAAAAVYYTLYKGKKKTFKAALKEKGIDSSLENRKRIAKLSGIDKYTGTKKQDEELLKKWTTAKSKGSKYSKLRRYAKGTQKVDKDQLAMLHELGPELQLVAGKTGKLEYITRGSAIIPSDISENLMKLGRIDPSELLQRNVPTVGINPGIRNTEVKLNIQYGDMLKIENFKGDNPEEIAKIVSKQFEKHTKQLNQSLRKYVR